MIKQPHEMTEEELLASKYGQWAGNEKGRYYHSGRCAESVMPKGMWYFSQCSRKKGHGPKGLYCKQHAKRHETKNDGGRP